jgi:hypothetical protein
MLQSKECVFYITLYILDIYNSERTTTRYDTVEPFVMVRRSEN